MYKSLLILIIFNSVKSLIPHHLPSGQLIKFKPNLNAPRSDLISLAYVIGYLLLGYLPWQNKKEKIKEKINYRYSCKSSISANYYKFLSYCEDLDFYDSPNYQYLYSLLENIS